MLVSSAETIGTVNTNVDNVNLHRPTSRCRTTRAASIASAMMLPATPAALAPCTQGLTLVHFLAQRERFVWDRGCIWALFRGCIEGARGRLGGLDGVLYARNGSG